MRKEGRKEGSKEDGKLYLIVDHELNLLYIVSLKSEKPLRMLSQKN